MARYALILCVATAAVAAEGAWKRYEAGLRAFKRGELKVAQQRFEAVLQSEPNFTDANYYLGAIAEKKRDSKTAAVYYARVEEKNAMYALSQERLGQIAQRADKLEDAIKHFVNVTKKKATVRTWQMLANAQLGHGAHPAAEKSLAEAKKLSKGNLTTAEMLARLYIETKRPAKALAQYDAILEKFPGDALARYMRGFVLQQLKRNTEALQDFEKVVEVDPFHKRAIRELIKAYSDVPEKEAWVAELEKRLERVRKNPPPVRRVAGQK